MRVTLWGTRGSLPTPGPETNRYGGNTPCVEVEGTGDERLIIDAGSGIRRLGMKLSGKVQRINLLLTHLHMDHVQGLGFFAPLYDPGVEVHIWGPSSTTQSLQTRLTRYLSPPLFPVRLRDLPSPPFLHEVPSGDFTVGDFHVSASLVCHPGPTVGYRVTAQGATVAYISDHEPALGAHNFPLNAQWTSGYDLAADADLLIHDAQYSSEEYLRYQGWGHSALDHAIAFAKLAGVKHLVPFHHDPAHDDATLDKLFGDSLAAHQPPFFVTPGTEGATFDLGG
jgi:phosphoribosyl 1,2-cyclic phosphodiesterase